MDLLTRFKEYILSNGLSHMNDRLLLAVSGGSDSVVMAHLFRQAHIDFAIAHCNFRLRGQESDLDEQLVRSLAEQYGVAFYCKGFDTMHYVTEHNCSVQEAARELRYAWFEQVRSGHGFTWVSTAHHLNDSLETLLINFFRGTGISGMHGIPDKQGKVIRPLLFARKEELLEYARINQLEFREDLSNNSQKYLRNQVRLQLIPAIKQVFGHLEQNLSGNIGRFREVEELYFQGIGLYRKKLMDQRGEEWFIPILKLQKATPLHTILYELLAPFGFKASQTSEVKELLDSQPGKMVSSHSHRILRDRKFLIITPIREYDGNWYSLLPQDRQLQVPGGKFILERIRLEKGDLAVILKNGAKDTALLNWQALEFPLKVRRWSQGDYFYPLGMGNKKKKISRLFIDRKIPQTEKGKIWILESGPRIAWVVGIHTDERFRVTEITPEILRIRYT